MTDEIKHKLDRQPPCPFCLGPTPTLTGTNPDYPIECTNCGAVMRINPDGSMSAPRSFVPDGIKSVPMTEVLENSIRDAEEQLKTATGDLAGRSQELLVDLKGRLAEGQKPGAVRVWQRILLKTNPGQK